MVGFFMKKEIAEMINKLEDQGLNQAMNPPVKKEIQH